MNSAKSIGDATVSRVWSKVRLVLFILVGLVGSALAIAAAVFLYSKWERRVAKNRIAITEIEVVAPELPLDKCHREFLTGPYTDCTFAGRVRNKSQYELSAIEVELTISDCVEKDCEVVGQSSKGIDLNIPPNQSRDFEEGFFFDPALGSPHGRLVWAYRVIQSCSNSGSRTLPCSELFWWEK